MSSPLEFAAPALAGASTPPSHDVVRQALASIRKHLGMEIAWVSRFDGDTSVFIGVDAPGLEDRIKPGDSIPLDLVYCRHILAGRLPAVMPDTADFELARSAPITSMVPVGSNMSVPICRKDGSVIGMFCCQSPAPNKSLNERDVQVMKVFADIAAKQIERDLDAEKAIAEKRGRLSGLIAERQFGFVFQPIWDFHVSRPTGFEVLCRFKPQPYRSPDKWFREADEAGFGTELEVAVFAGALATLAAFPPDVSLAINASPATILGGALDGLVDGHDTSRIVIEITEHAPVADYVRLRDKVDAMRARGLRLAIDDAGAGYSSLQHIVSLRPDVIKLDMSLTRAVDVDPARRALAAALVFFARETRSVIVAEGIETASELDTLRRLDVSKGQGYFLSRPLDLEAALALLREHEPNAR